MKEGEYGGVFFPAFISTPLASLSIHKTVDFFSLLQQLNSGFQSVNNIVGKERNGACQYNVLFPQNFQKSSFLGRYTPALFRKGLQLILMHYV